MKRKNAAAFCRDLRSDALLRAQADRVQDGDSRLDQLVEIGQRAGYRFSAQELSAAMGAEPVGASPLAHISVSQSLSEHQLAAVAGAGWSMEEHWGAEVKKPTVGGSLPGVGDPIEP